jgi:3-oxoacyl-[acyl-carrier protein] reductase
MDEFVGKVALITGAGHGMGQELALAFSVLGVSVAANDINPISLDAMVSQILQAGGIARAYVFDVAKRMPIEAMVAQVLEHFGHIDILVNHASVEPDAYLLEMDEWDFHRTMDVNLGGPFFCIQQVGRIMRQQGGGAVVNIVSTFGQVVLKKGHSAHLASQVGLVGLTQAAAQELSAHNIRVNAVCHGSNAMGLVSTQAWDMAAYQQWQLAMPALQLGDHSDLVRLVLFLCSQDASSITGQVIYTR